MISLLATTTCNHLENFKNFNSSINFPIKTLSILVNNYDMNYFDEVRAIPKNPLVENYEYSYCPRNMGCSSSWNYHIKHHPKENYWIQCSDDVKFQSTELFDLYNLMEQGYDGAFAERCNYVLFGLNRHMIRTVGFFDENFHPGCFEDNDYRDRVNKCSEVKFVEFPVNFIHNGSPAGAGGGGTGVHFNSEQAEFWKTCYSNNESYYQDKKSQMDKISLWFWRFDIDRRAEQEFII